MQNGFTRNANIFVAFENRLANERTNGQPGQYIRIYVNAKGSMRTLWTIFFLRRRNKIK